MVMFPVLITGGAGFIGRWLTKRWIEAGHQVFILDNLRTGRIENLAEFHGHFRLLRADVRDTVTVARELQANEIQIVYHLAALHYIPYCERYPRETFDTNVGGTVSLLQAMELAGVRRMIFASTGAIYHAEDRPLSETAPVAPQSIYGLTKLHAEMVINYFESRSGVLPAIVRLFNTYGPYETNPHLLPDIIDTLKSGKREVHLGNLYPKRDYVYVEDVAEGLYRLGLRSDAVGVYNLGTGVEYSVREVVDTLELLLGEKLHIVQDRERMRPNDKEHQRADVSRLEAALGWRPRVALSEGLLRWLEHEGLVR